MLKSLYLLSHQIDLNMKKVLTFLLTILTAVSAIAADSLTVFYRIRLDQDIDQSSQRLVTLGLEKAREADADYVLLDLNTYGGAVDAADSIRSAILRNEKPVIAYVNMQAASAGALIRAPAEAACILTYAITGFSFLRMADLMLSAASTAPP